MRQAAVEDGRFELIVTDAQDQTAKQISDVEDLLARRVHAVFLTPREVDGVEPALEGRDTRGSRSS
jgi:ribose transport system substrate-binding protein